MACKPSCYDMLHSSSNFRNRSCPTVNTRTYLSALFEIFLYLSMLRLLIKTISRQIKTRVQIMFRLTVLISFQGPTTDQRSLRAPRIPNLICTPVHHPPAAFLVWCEHLHEHLLPEAVPMVAPPPQTRYSSTKSTTSVSKNYRPILHSRANLNLNICQAMASVDNYM